MEKIVIVGYKPLEGKADQLRSLTIQHWSQLNAIGLVSERTPIIMEGEDGTIIEIFWPEIQISNGRSPFAPKKTINMESLCRSLRIYTHCKRPGVK